MGAELGVVVVVAATTWIAAVVLLCARPDAGVRLVAGLGLLGGIAGASLAHVVWPDRDSFGAAVLAAYLIAAAAYVQHRRRAELSVAGAFAWTTWLVFGASASAWSLGFLAGLDVSTLTRVLLWSGVGLAAVTMPSAIVTTREGWNPLLRATPVQPRLPGALPDGAKSPRVSIHVPCHAEPPEVVISTLDRLADLEYDNVEVLVIDNNTTDPALWLPVRDHCTRLGDRFRFLHVEGISGAKAGALNWALPYTDPDAELIAVVDADYHVEPFWLRETVGYFSDPEIGFVQAPHAYRGHEGSRFATWANAEYSVFFHTGMVSLDEAGAGLTVGTMSLLRRQALEEAGGWAEWCLTEDSELSIRIHDAGYRSVYLTEPYGRGLVPDTFEGYRRQRFRWTYGPVQEFRQHWRRFLPRVVGGRAGALTASQRLHHANHGVDVAGIGIRGAALLVGVAAGLSMVLHREVVQVPFELWAASTAALVTSWAMRLLVYRRVLGVPWGQALGGITAFASLSLIITVASVRSSLGLSSAWQRTNKFRSSSDWRNALAAARTEAVLAGALLVLALVVLLGSPQHSGVALMLAIALTAKAITFLTAPVVAIVADRDLRAGKRVQRAAPVTSTVLVPPQGSPGAPRHRARRGVAEPVEETA